MPARYGAGAVRLGLYRRSPTPPPPSVFPVAAAAGLRDSHPRPAVVSQLWLNAVRTREDPGHWEANLAQRAGVDSPPSLTRLHPVHAPKRRVCDRDSSIGLHRGLQPTSAPSSPRVPPGPVQTNRWAVGTAGERSQHPLGQVASRGGEMTTQDEVRLQLAYTVQLPHQHVPGPLRGARACRSSPKAPVPAGAPLRRNWPRPRGTSERRAPKQSEVKSTPDVSS